MTQPYRPPVDVDFGAPLPHRLPAALVPPAGEPHTFELAGYSLMAGVHDGRLFVRAPGASTDEVLAALQAIVDALQADDAPAEFSEEEVTCPNCGRDHIPDEGENHTTCVECLDGRGDDE